MTLHPPDGEPTDASEGDSFLFQICTVCRLNSVVAELMYESINWRFYYCSRCVHWFKSQPTEDGGCGPLELISDEATLRALTAQYHWQRQFIQGSTDLKDSLTRWKRGLVYRCALLHLKLSRATGRARRHSK